MVERLGGERNETDQDKYQADDQDNLDKSERASGQPVNRFQKYILNQMIQDAANHAQNYIYNQEYKYKGKNPRREFRQDREKMQ